MVDILHRIGVEGRRPDDGLRGTDHRERPRRLVDRGHRATATSAACSSSGSRKGASTWRSSRPSPAKSVVWKVVDGPDGVDRHHGRAGSSRQDGDYTIVLFQHEGWREPVEFMHHCSTKWAIFLMSLKALVETGVGAPAPARRDDQQLALAPASPGGYSMASPRYDRETGTGSAGPS